MSRGLLLLFSALLLLPAAEAQDCTSVLTELRGFTSPLFASHSEFVQVKQDVLLLLYSRERAVCSTALTNFASRTLEYLKTMDASFVLLSSSETEKHREGVERAIEAEGIILEMESLAAELGPVAGDAVFAAEQGRRSLLLASGMFFERRAEEAKSTRERLELLELAILSYGAADALQAKNLAVRRQNLEERYTSDMEKASRYLDSAVSGLRIAEGLSTSFPGFIDAYGLARDAIAELRRAQEIYALHSEKEKLIQVEESLSRAREIYSVTRNRILLLFGVLSAVLTSLAVYIQSRILSWEKDSYDCSLGNELVGD